MPLIADDMIEVRVVKHILKTIPKNVVVGSYSIC